MRQSEAKKCLKDLNECIAQVEIKAIAIKSVFRKCGDSHLTHNIKILLGIIGKIRMSVLSNYVKLCGQLMGDDELEVE